MSMSNAQIIVVAGSRQVVLNKDPTVWLKGARPPPKLLISNFKFVMNLSF